MLEGLSRLRLHRECEDQVLVARVSAELAQINGDSASDNASEQIRVLLNNIFSLQLVDDPPAVKFRAMFAGGNKSLCSLKLPPVGSICM